MRITRTQLRRIIREAILQESWEEFDGYGKLPPMLNALAQAIEKKINKFGGPAGLARKKNPLQSLKSGVKTQMGRSSQAGEYSAMRDRDTDPARPRSWNMFYEEALQEIINQKVGSYKEIGRILTDRLVS